MNKLFISFLLLLAILVGIGVWYVAPRAENKTPVPQEQQPATTIATTTTEATTTTQVVDKTQTVIGTSVQRRDIVAYHFGAGPKEVVFVGGVHGGYEWNTVLVARELMNYLKQNPTSVPENVTVTVIPVLNPDGLNTVVGTTSTFSKTDVASSLETQTKGRFNAHTVDLNRNFDCDWQATGTWQSKKVSGGTAAFSEPESVAFKQYVEAHKPVGVVVWFSAADGVYSSNCHGGVSAETKTLTDLFAKASGYPAHENFDFYAVTGDMTNWLAKINIPAISVLLKTHDQTEWDKNQGGVQAVLQHFAQ